MADSRDSRPQLDPADEAEDGFRTLVDALPDAILVHSQERIVFVNPRCVGLLGAEGPDQLLGRSIYEIIHPEFHAAVRDRTRDCYATGEASPPAENILISLDGSSIPIETTAMPIAWRGSPAIEVVIRDISRRKAAEKSLREYESVVEGLDDMIVVVDREFRIVAANRAFFNYRSMEREEAIGHLISEMIPKELFDMVVRMKLEECFAGNVVKFEMKNYYPKLGARDLFISHFPIESAGVVTGAACVLRDITERKRAEEALRTSAQKQRQIGEQLERERASLLEAEDVARMGSWEVMLPSLAVIWSQQTHRIFETDPSTFQPTRPRFCEFIHPDDREKVDAAFFGSLGNHLPCTVEYRIVMPDGRVKILEERWLVFRDEEGEPVRAAGTCRDITERRQEESERRALEQQLRQAQKMEAVGRLAGGIAHDFNNLLMVIRSYTEMLQDRLSAQDPLRKSTHEIINAADRAASLTRQMLAFSRKQILSPVVLDLNAVIAETVKMLRRMVGEHIEFRLIAVESLWMIEADSDQMVQVLMNLCVNARDAMPRGGTLTIATGNVSVEEGGLGGRSYVAPGDYVTLSVTDTGTGIEPAILESIFEPFFSTKELGKGTGLGLSTVFGVVKQSGGYVWVESEVGQGACFTILLPRTKDALTPHVSVKAEGLGRGTETLLVVEDEEALRESICEFLRSLGYTALAAGTGHEALSEARKHAGRIDLLLTDIVMPKMSGRELSQMLERLHPDLKTIYMSGYTDDAVFQHGLFETMPPFLQKPFSLSTLARKVRETLGQTKKVG
jgi:PAS domain S-box-containing protein